jgi:hypothetical protein
MESIDVYQIEPYGREHIALRSTLVETIRCLLYQKMKTPRALPTLNALSLEPIYPSRIPLLPSPSLPG